MSEKLTFTGVQLLGFGRDGKGGKATFSAGLNGVVQRAMGWGEIPEFLTGGDLEGELAATTITLVPKEAELKRHETEVEVSKISKFLSIRLELEGNKGKGHRTEIRFTVTFADKSGAAKLERYIQSCGKSTMQVNYEKQAKQEDLPGVEVTATDEQRQAAMEIN